MRLPNRSDIKPPGLNTVIIIVFLVAWLYTEVREASQREYKWEYVKEFVSKGGRFTAEDGEELDTRVIILEKQREIDDLKKRIAVQNKLGNFYCRDPNNPACDWRSSTPYSR